MNVDVFLCIDVCVCPYYCVVSMSRSLFQFIPNVQPEEEKRKEKKINLAK